MTSVNIHEAKTHLSRLIERAERGEEVVIARAGKPVVKLTRVAPSKRAAPGFGKGTIKVHGEITDPMPDEWLDMFYNAPVCTNDAKTPVRRKRRSQR